MFVVPGLGAVQLFMCSAAEAGLDREAIFRACVVARILFCVIVNCALLAGLRAYYYVEVWPSEVLLVYACVAPA